MSYWTDEIERLLRERDGEHARARAAERQLEEIRKINDIANARLDASDKIAVELKAAKSNLEYYREARDLAVDKKAAAEKKLKELNLRVDTVVGDAAATWMKTTHDLQKRLNGAAIELENTVRQLENVRGERETLKAELSRIRESGAAWIRERDELRKKFDESERRLNHMDQAYNARSDERDAARAGATIAEESLRIARNERDELRGHLEFLHAEATKVLHGK